MTRTTTHIWLIGLILGFAIFSFSQFGFGHSPDLMATWMAGHFYGAGALDQIYPADTSVYTMYPPSDWWPWLQEQGREKSVFPFVYPPIWAVISSWITPFVSIDAFQAGASILNPILLGASVVLALKTAGLRGQEWILGSTLGMGIMLFTLSGAVALEQNQPQILVTFLIILALERDRSGALKMAGAALALAAAIKLYPALIAVLWLANRRWGSLRSFAIMGGIFGVASIVLAGWPLHKIFLHEIGIIADTVLVTSFTYGIDPTIAQIFMPDHLRFIAGLDNDPSGVQAGWAIMQKPPIWAAASMFGLAVLTTLSIRHLWQNGDRNGLFIPAFLVALALISPLSWGYHYLPALCFLPALLTRFGTRIGGALMLIIAFAVSIPALDLLAPIPFTDLFPQIVGTLAMVLLGIVLAVAPPE